MSSLLLRTVTDGGTETDQGGLVLDLLRLNYRIVDSGEVAIGRFMSKRPVYGNS